jgi:hypothetical protein
VAKTRHLNIWVGADEALFSMRSWHEAADTTLQLENFEGQECHLGLDLVSRTDLAALAIVFPGRDSDTGKVTYTAFARCYLNEDAVTEGRGPANSPPEAGSNRHLRPVNSPPLTAGTEPLGEAEPSLTNNPIWQA